MKILAWAAFLLNLAISPCFLSLSYAKAIPTAQKSVADLSDLKKGLKPTDLKSHIFELKEAVDRLKDYSFDHIQKERFGDELGPLMKIRVKYSQGRIYLHMLEGPKQNAEVIFKPGWNDGKVKVHKGSFPDIAVSVQPHGSLMMDTQHHPVEFLDFQVIVNTLVASARRCERFPGAGIKEVASPTTQAVDSDLITLELQAPWIEKENVVGQDEDIWSFAKRMGSDPYLILHNNGLKDIGDISSGMQLKVPECYATRTLLTLNRKTHLPVQLITYDGKGRLYETYDWQNFDTKPLSDIDFDPDNQEYHF